MTLGFQTGSIGTGTVAGSGSSLSARTLTVGKSGSGRLSITDGGVVSVSGTTIIGGSMGSAGAVAVDGIGSTLASSALDISSSGSPGTGTLTISGGATVTANQTSVAGSVAFVSGGGTLATQTLSYASSSQFTGTGQINAAGVITDGALLFDSTHEPSQIFSWNGPAQNITLTLDLTGHSGPVGELGAGYIGTGSLMIKDGLSITSVDGTFGINQGAIGTGTVSGPGSTWTTTNIYLGESGVGILNVINGATLKTSTTSYIGVGIGSGTATVQGTGSTWTSSNLLVGYGGPGTLNILSGATVKGNYEAIIGFSNGSGTVIVDGVGSTLTTFQFEVGDLASGDLIIRNGGAVHVTGSSLLGEQGAGTVIVDGPGSSWTASTLSIGTTSESDNLLAISDGGLVHAASVNIDFGSLLAIDAGDGTTLDDHTGTFANAGMLRIKAAPSANAGSYTPILANTWSGSGSVQALGGRWSSATHTFTIAVPATTASGQPVTLNLLQTQRALITDAPSGHLLQVGFQSTAFASNVTLTATPINPPQTTSLQNALSVGESILAGWTFTTAGAGYKSGSPVFVSLGVGPNYTASALNIWQYDGSTWSSYSPADLSYDGTYADFTATSLVGYAVVTTYNLLGDANIDGKVDLSDLNIVLNNLGTTTSLRSAGSRFDGQPTIDLTDLNDDVLNNLGTTYAANNVSSVATPEPTSLTIATLLALPLLKRRRHHQLTAIA